MMKILGREPAGSTDQNLAVVLIPFQNGARTDPKFPAHLGRHRYLPLRCEF